MTDLLLRTSDQEDERANLDGPRVPHPNLFSDRHRTRPFAVPASVWVPLALVVGAAPWVALAVMALWPELFW